MVEKKKNISRKKKAQVATIIAMAAVSSVLWLNSVFAFTIYSFSYVEKEEPEPNIFDVGEKVTFIWDIDGDYDSAWVKYGDGVIDQFAPNIDNCTHRFQMEGKYNVTLTIKKIGQQEITVPLDNGPIHINNTAPIFDFLNIIYCCSKCR